MTNISQRRQNIRRLLPDDRDLIEANSAQRLDVQQMFIGKQVVDLRVIIYYPDRIVYAVRLHNPMKTFLPYSTATVTQPNYVTPDNPMTVSDLRSSLCWRESIVDFVTREES